MFWGITIENGKRYSQIVNESFHVSMAALESQINELGASSKNDSVAVMIEREKSEFLLCTLQHGSLIQQPLDLNFVEGEEVTLFLNGEGVVHLTGYVVETEVDDEDENDAFLYEEKKASGELKRKKGSDGGSEVKKKKVDSIDDGDSLEDDDSDDDDSDEDLFQNVDEESGSSDNENQIQDKDSDSSSNEDSYTELMIKSVKQKKDTLTSAKKTGGVPALVKSPKSGVEATPKVSGKPKVVHTPHPNVKSTKKPNEQKNEIGLPTPTPVNGDQESSSSKKKKRRNKKSKASLSTSDAGSPNKSQTPDQQASPVLKKGAKKLQGGVIVEDTFVGNGPEAKSGKVVQVYYTGKLPNSKEFDAVRKGETPFKFRLGKNEVIKGWDVGIQGMKVGGKRKITVPPHQGYGNKALQSIPRNSTLHFDVHLISVS